MELQIQSEEIWVRTKGRKDSDELVSRDGWKRKLHADTRYQDGGY
jgi:hypothetical protein